MTKQTLVKKRLAYAIHGCTGVARDRMPEATMEVDEALEQGALAVMPPYGSAEFTTSRFSTT